MTAKSCITCQKTLSEEDGITESFYKNQEGDDKSKTFCANCYLLYEIKREFGDMHCFVCGKKCTEGLRFSFAYKRGPSELLTVLCCCLVECRNQRISMLKNFTKKMNSSYEKQCTYCGAGSKDAKRCSRCQCAIYCNVECQKAHWKVHKHFCKH